jgi:outer membrane protein TolC
MKQSYSKISGLLLAVALLTSSSVRSQALSWNECLELAQKNNSELRAAEESLRASAFSLRGSFGNFLPQISGSLAYAKSHSSSSNNSLTSTIDDYSAGISASENLFSGFSDFAKLKTSRANLEIARSNLLSVKAKISFDLKSNYSSLLYAEHSVSLSEAVLKRREENLRLVELRFQSGRENKGSLLLSKAYLEQAKLDLMQSKNNIRSYSAGLARVLSQNSEGDFEVKGEVPTGSLQSEPDFKTLVLDTPDRRLAQAELELSEAAVISSRASLLPSFSVNTSLGREGSEWFPAQNRWSAGFTLSVPLFSGGKDFYSLRGAAATADASSFAKENTDRVTLAKLKSLHANFKESIQRLKVDESFLTAALARAEIARSKYQNGLITFEDWDLIENDLIARQKSMLQSQRDRVIAEASWEQAQGKGVIP